MVMLLLPVAGPRSPGKNSEIPANGGVIEIQGLATGNR
jgi:hypothetical protein